MSKQVGEEIGMSLDKILGQLDEDERADLLTTIVEQQITTILEQTGDISPRQKKEKEKIVKDAVRRVKTAIV